jgi:hypothetical protein
MKRFLQDYYEQSAGSVYVCCVNGKRLLYRDIPAAAETLTVHYYKAPDVLVDDDDIPVDIPEHLRRKLIVSHVLMGIYSEIELHVNGRRINTEYYENRFNEGLTELIEMFPQDKVPEYYEDANDYID